MTQLYFALLGSPEVLLGDTVLNFSTRKALALLIYLAVEGGPQTRKALSELFWPELDAKHGRAALRATLLKLRQLLEPEEPSTKPYLLIDQDTLLLDLSSGVVLDVHLLETAYKEVRALSRRSTPLHGKKRRLLCQQLEQVTALCRGEFLAGFSTRDASAFDDWVRYQREVYRQQLHQIFDTLSVLYIEGGENELALATLTRWIAFDPLHEPAYRSLMRLYFALGDRVAALRAYESCRTQLEAELQVQVMPETTALAEYIRTTVPPMRMETNLAPSLQLPIPLVGRASEFRLLIERYAEAYRLAPQGQPQIVLLEGATGIGKTRLATEFLGWAASKGAQVLQARAFEHGERLPYQLFVELLRSGLEQDQGLQHDPLHALSSVWLAELSRLLPEIREYYPDLRAHLVDEMTARPRMFEAVARLIEVCASSQSLLLYLDDVQWADSATLDLLSFLVSRWTKNRTAILLLLCVNSEDVTLTSQLASWQAGMSRIATLARVPLQPLNSNDIFQLLQALQQGDGEATAQSQREAPSPLNEELDRASRWLLHETDGYPFHLVETLKVLLEREILVLQQDEHGQPSIDFQPLLAEQERISQHIFPLSIYELVRMRLQPLTSAARALLVAGAVLNQQATFERLCVLAELTPKEGLEALDEVQSASLLRETEQVEERSSTIHYQFTHRKIREVVYTEAGKTRLRLFHARALELLEQASASPVELAYHAMRAEQRVAAFRYSLLAGDKALTIFAIQDALVHYEQAQHLLSEKSGEQQLRKVLSFADLQHLYSRMGWVYASQKDWTKARRSFEKLLANAQEVQDLSAIGRALNLLALLSVQQPKGRQMAQKHLEEAQRIAQMSGDPSLLAETEWNQALVAMSTWDRVGVETHVQSALEFARVHGVKGKILQCLLYLGMHALYTGSYAQALQYAQEAFAFCNAMEQEATSLAEMQVEVPPLWSYLGLPPLQLTTPRSAKLLCLLLLLLCQVQLGDPQAGEETGRTALALSLETNDQWAQIYSMGYLACVLLEVGAYGEALLLMRRAQGMTDHLSPPIVRFFTLWISGIVHQTLLRQDEARVALEEAAALMDTALLPTHKALLVFPPLCANYALMGERGQAYSYALEAHEERERIGIVSTMFDFFRDYEISALLLHSERQAEEVIRKFTEQIGEHRRFRIVALRAQAALAQKYGDVELAIEYLREAMRLTETIGLPGTCWQIQGALGRLYQKQGARELSAQSFARAMRIIQQLAERMQDEEMRTTFLSAPLLQEIIASQRDHLDAIR